MRKCTKKWTMKDGAKIRICDMSDSHLLNTIKLLQRYHGSIISWYLNCSGPSGEMAVDAFDDEFNALDEAGPSATSPLFDDLCKDAFRRDILTYDTINEYQLRLM